MLLKFSTALKMDLITIDKGSFKSTFIFIFFPIKIKLQSFGPFIQYAVCNNEDQGQNKS